ncbi:putative disease resistance protein At1g50180 isoform X1 [Humulus lupulus]|uniref:putative disease resistance protein At1g50180 isoform X1 n=1 Tax=Humulus lupulus TaxID=3486 RepID=UPI002B407139|nr:putative disease resistance protein At1g50180 isoform X1 [Humulus lupulus]
MSLILRYLPFFPYNEQDPVEEDIAEALLAIFVVFSIVLIVVNHQIVQYLDDNSRWIKREWKLLDALAKDFQTVNKSVDVIKHRANQVWESELNLRGITQTLSEIEKQWLTKEAKVSSDAQRYVEDYEKLIIVTNGASTNLIKRYVSLVFKKFIPIVELALGISRIKKEITSQLEQKKEYTNSIVKKLEESRIKVRSLQDRPIDEAEQSFVIGPMPPFRSGVALVLERLVTEEPKLVRGVGDKVLSLVMQLQLLRAFMKDLRELRLESEIEKVWVEEAQQITARSQNDVNTFLQDAADQPRWLAFITDYRLLRRKLENVINNVGNEVSHLLETKQRYGFNLIKRQRDSSKDAVTTTSSTVILNQVDYHEHISSSHEHDEAINKLRIELENTRKQLEEEEATNVATNTRKACFEFLRKMTSEVESSADIKRVQRIEETFILLKRFIQVYKIKVMEESCSVVGLEEDVLKFLKMTTNRDPYGSIFSIIGMKGVGKTTLAKEILNHKSIINYFHVRHFVSVPEETDDVILLRSVGNQILRTQDERNEKLYWINKLRGYFNENPCLLVLDNLWSKEAWDILKPAVLSDRNTGTIMLITTRDKAVASHANSSNIHQLRLRTGEESWEFFTQIVSCPVDEDVEKLAKKVVTRTGGLPLAILRLGYLLSGKILTEEELSVVLERVTQGQNQIPWVAIRDTIKEDFPLQSDLENCLSYFELFPKDSEISARRLVALWVAQGLRQSDNTNGVRTQEKLAYNYLLELIGRNIIQIVERKLNGKVLTCQFPGILRELWLASRTNNTAVRSWSLCGSLGQKLAYRFDDDDASFSRRIHRLDHSNLLPEENCPLSVMFFDTREGHQPGEDIRNFLSKAITTGRILGLVILDLEHVYKPQLPSIIGNLKKLTYLGLRWTQIKNLPESIGQLSSLQTLDLKHTLVQKLPSSIWKLKKLRNLHLNGSCQIKTKTPPNNLHKLSGVLVNHEGRALMDGLPKLKNLQKLRLTIQLTPRLQEDLARHIQELTNLQSLSLKSIDESSEPQELYVPHLNNLTQLSSLSLTGKIRRSSVMFDLPQSLTELTLSSSEISTGDLLMQMLGNYLPELKFLYFLSDSYCGTEMVFDKGFPKLLVLNLWNLPNLETLVVEEGVMPKLRVLEIRSCLRLTVPTTKLPKFSTLTELKLSNMPEEYTADLKKKSQKLKHNPRIKSFAFPPMLRSYPRNDIL